MHIELKFLVFVIIRIKNSLRVLFIFKLSTFPVYFLVRIEFIFFQFYTFLDKKKCHFKYACKYKIPAHNLWQDISCAIFSLILPNCFVYFVSVQHFFIKNFLRDLDTNFFLLFADFILWKYIVLVSFSYFSYLETFLHWFSQTDFVTECSYF